MIPHRLLPPSPPQVPHPTDRHTGPPTAANLHTAFDTTPVALALSLILVYLLHRGEADEEGFVVQAVEWCMRRLVFRMHMSGEGARGSRHAAGSRFSACRFSTFCPVRWAGFWSCGC